MLFATFSRLEKVNAGNLTGVRASQLAREVPLGDQLPMHPVLQVALVREELLQVAEAARKPVLLQQAPRNCGNADNPTDRNSRNLKIS